MNVIIVEGRNNMKMFYLLIGVMIGIFITPKIAVGGLTDLAAGYAVGKSGQTKTVIPSNNKVMDVIPVSCTLYGTKCIGGDMGRDGIPVTAVCGKLGSEYVSAGFMKVGKYDSSIIVLCKKEVNKKACRNCHGR